jgi:hypothetical protein
MSLGVFAQEASISLGNNNIALNQAFSITITVTESQIKNYSAFPDIPGFKKHNTSSMSSTNIVNGNVSSSTSIVQNYVANKEGKFVLKPFKMSINGKDASSGGTTITVGPPLQTQQRRGFQDDDWDPFDEFFGRGKKAPKEYVDVQDDAFFMVQSDKKSVWRGEGFLLMVAFYVGEQNRAQLNFPSNFTEQLTNILKKIKPATCWEENFDIREVVPELVTIENKRYRRYKLYQAMMYPINAQKIKIPSVELEMIKYKEAKNPSFFGNNLQEDYKKYPSASFEINVKELPAHPLRETVPVGIYSMMEAIRGKKMETGKSFTLDFQIQGEGNLNSLEAPLMTENPNFEFYTPEVRQSISRSENKVSGSKIFSIPIIPKEPGTYKLRDYVQIPYFDPKRGRYDTIFSTLKVNITGESQKNAAIQANEYDSFYQAIENESNKFSFNYYTAYVKLLANSLLLVMLLATGFIVLRPLKEKYKK